MPNAMAPKIQNALLYESQQGVAPFGMRHDSFSPKGKGYFGALRNPNGGVSTEVSANMDGFEFPLLVPTLTKDEINQVMLGESIPESVYAKAYKYAMDRQAQGLSPFAGAPDLRVPAGFLSVKGY